MVNILVLEAVIKVCSAWREMMLVCLGNVDHQHTQGGALEFGIAKDLGYLFLEGLEGVVFDGRNGRKEDLERGRWCGMEGQREKKQTAQEAGY